MQTLQDDGVDLEALFYACAYESVMSEGGWMPLESSTDTLVLEYSIPSPVRVLAQCTRTYPTN